VQEQKIIPSLDEEKAENTVCPEFTTVYHMNERKGRKIVEKLDERND
jgi:hypothetical protein